jgi:hypothetical protein
MLRPLPVDLEELAGILEGDPLNAGGRIDLTTGEVWPQVAIQYALETGEEDEDSADDAERWLAVHNEGSREPYRLGPPPHPPRSPFQCRKLIGDIATAAHRAPPLNREQQRATRAGWLPKCVDRPNYVKVANWWVEPMQLVPGCRNDLTAR